MRVTMRALNPSGWDMQTQIWPHWLLTNSAPHGGRHALLACSAEAAAALFAMDKLLTPRPDNYPDTGGSCCGAATCPKPTNSAA